MAKHRGTASVHPAPSEEVEGLSRRARAPQGTWKDGLLALPWVTLVLLVLVAVLGLVLLRPDTYAATARISSVSDQAGRRAAVALTAVDLVPRVEREIELDPRRSGEMHLDIDRNPQEGVVLVSASATDPRLAALAADTAAALVVAEFADELELAAAAPIPAAPVERISGWWGAAAVVCLGGALLVERRHHRWELRHSRLSGPVGAGR